MEIDGIWVPAEYDPDTGIFSYKVKNRMRSGRHAIKLSITDKQGNQVIKTAHFTIL
jgi:hypothetical protein